MDEILNPPTGYENTPEAPKLDFWDAAQKSAEVNWVNPSRLMASRPDADPTFDVKADGRWAKVPETWDEDQMVALWNSNSAEEFDDMYQYFDEKNAIRMELAADTSVSTAIAQYGTAFLDPSFIAASAVSGGTASGWIMAAKLGRIGRMARLAAVGGASDTAVNFVRKATEADYTYEDLAFDSAISFAVSGIGGAFLSRNPDVANALTDAVKRSDEAAAARYAGQGSMGAAERNLADDGSWARWDDHKQLMRSDNDALIDFAKWATEDPVKGGQHSVATFVETFGNGFNLQLQDAFIKSYREYIQEVPRAKRSLRRERLEQRELFTAAMKYIETGQLPQHGGKAVKRAAAAAEDVFARMGNLAKEHGVNGFQEFIPKKGYVPHIWKEQKVAKAIGQHGERKAMELIAGSLVSKAIKNGDLPDPETAAKIAIGVVTRKMDALNFDKRTLDEIVNDPDIRPFLDKLDTGEDDFYEKFVASARKKAPVSDQVKDTVDRAKKRMDFDMDFSVDGLSMYDFLETDLSALSRQYVNNMAATVGLAKHGRIKSPSDLHEMLNNIQLKGDAVSPGQGKIDRKKAERMLNKLYGRPVYDNPEGTFARSMRTLGKANFTMGMGVAAFSALTELGKVMVENGVRNSLKQFPQILDIVRYTIKPTAKARGLVTEFNRMGAGIGSESHRMYLHSYIDEDMLARGDEDALEIAETFADSASRVMSRVSLLAPVDRTIREFAFNTASDAVYKFATTGKKPRWNLKELGMSKGRMDAVLENIRKHAKVENGKVTQLGMEHWPQDLAHEYMESMVRLNGRQVQKELIGEGISLLGGDSPVGAMLIQFRRFGLVSWANHSLRDIHQITKEGNKTPLFVWGLGTAMAAFQYTARTHAQAIGMDENERSRFLKQRLSTQSIIANAVNYTPAFGMPVLGYNTVAGHVDQNILPVLSVYRASGDSSFEPWMNPTFSNAQRLSRVVGGVLGGNDRTVEEILNDGYRLIPMNNTLPGTALKNLATNFSE